MDLFKVFTTHKTWTYHNHAKLSLRTVYTDINIINDVRGESLFFAIYLFYIKQVQWQIFLKIEFVKIFVKLVIISWMPFTQSVGFVFDPNACLLYFEAGEFYHVSTFLIKLQAVLKEWKKMTRFLWNWTLSLPIYLLSLWLSMTTPPNSACYISWF